MIKSGLLASAALLIASATNVLAASSASSEHPVVALALPPVSPPLTFVPGYSSSWFKQIGLTATIETQANGGKGFVIGFVDTGIVATQADVAGRVSSLSSCAALTFRCSNGVYDDNGHGTATAAIGAGANVANGSSMMGVAPSATIVEEKVLNASGSGTDLDVANGINKAVAAGAQVINLSLTYLPTTNVINAINAAASRGVIIVFAGGNSSAPLNNNANSTGLTTTALSHLVFAGSVNSSNVLSSFSNTPGTGSAVAPGKSASYASLWLDAPGENIVAPGVQFGPNSLAYWTGTSMAAPIVTGALALLETTWPILIRNGTATSVLFVTATDLGAVGVDTKYGNGLLYLTRAFQPVGTLTVIEANGQSIPVTSLTGTMVVGGALGTLSKVSSALSAYTAFDSFARNYYVNLSSLLTVKTSISLSSLQVFGPIVTGGMVQLPNGGHAFFEHTDGALTPGVDGQGYLLPSALPGAAGPVANMGAWLLSYSDTQGTAIAVGRGFSSAPMFASALWGSDSARAQWAETTGQTSDVLSLASGGTLFAFGMNLGEHTRIAAATSATEQNFRLAEFNGVSPHASAGGVGITTRLVDGWDIGATLQYLHERNGLLGATYTGGMVSFGRSHSSTQLGLDSTLELLPDTDLIAGASIVRVGAVQNASAFVDNSTDILARSYEFGLVERRILDDNDAVSLTAAKPLRIVSGSLGLVWTTVDAQGLPVTAVRRVGLTPDGDETDLSLGYSRHVDGSMRLEAAIGVQMDAGNVRGAEGGLARLRLDLAL